MDPQQRFLLRMLGGVAVGFAITTLGGLVLGLALLAQPGGSVRASDPTTRAVVLVIGWGLLAAGPVLGLRIGGMRWGRAAWALPAVPLLVLLFDLVV